MARSVPEIIENIAKVNKEIEQKRESVAGLQSHVDTCDAMIKNDPDGSADLVLLRDQAAETIASENAELEALYKQKATLEAEKAALAPEKWSREAHPKFREQSASQATAEPEAAVEIREGDIVMAKYTDGKLYRAKVREIAGPLSNRVYSVTWIGYDNDGATRLTRADIKPIPPQKRKAEDDPAPKPTTPAAPNSAAVSSITRVGTSTVAAPRPEPSLVSDGPPKPAKIKHKAGTNKGLERAKNTWRDFNSKGKGKKAVQKESMFRTPDNPKARVGFTGSGRPLTKDPTRARNKFSPEDDDEE